MIILEEAQYVCEEIPDCIGITQVIEQFELRAGYQCRVSIGQTSWIQTSKKSPLEKIGKFIENNITMGTDGWEHHTNCYLSGYPASFNRQKISNGSYAAK